MQISYQPLDVCSRSYELFTIIYDLRNRQILQLESVSADIWAFITSRKSTNLDDILAYITEIYECSKEEIRDDVIDFLQDLYDSGILQFDSKYCSSDNRENSADEKYIQDTDDFEGQIINQLESENQIYAATIEMTYACNEKCVHCYAHYPTADMSTDHISVEEYCRFIDELYEAHAMHLSFTGGDPFMNKSFMDVFKYCRSKGFVADIFTNGLWLSDHPSELETLLSLRPRAFYISIYGASPKVHDSITGIPGSFNKTINIIKRIRNADISVVFNIMLLSENHKYLNEIINMADQLGAEYRASMSLINRNDGSSSPMEHFIGNKDDIKHVLKTIRNKVFSVDRPITNQPGSDYMCGAGVTSVCLSPDGTVYPCVSLKSPLGNIKAETFSEIWNGEKRNNIVSSLKWENTKECKTCSLKNICPHCAGMSKAENGDIFSCNTCDKIISECISEL